MPADTTALGAQDAGLPHPCAARISRTHQWHASLTHALHHVTLGAGCCVGSRVWRGMATGDGAGAGGSGGARLRHLVGSIDRTPRGPAAARGCLVCAACAPRGRAHAVCGDAQGAGAQVLFQVPSVSRLPPPPPPPRRPPSPPRQPASPPARALQRQGTPALVVRGRQT